MTFWEHAFRGTSVLLAFYAMYRAAMAYRKYRIMTRVWCLHEHQGWIGLVPRSVLDNCSRTFWTWYQRGRRPTDDTALAYRTDGFGAFRMRANGLDVIYLHADDPKLRLLLDGVFLERREFFMFGARHEAYFADAYNRLHGRPVPPEIVNALVAI